MVNFNPMDYGYIVRWQADLVYTIESVVLLPVWDIPYHMNNGFQKMWAEIKNLLNHHDSKLSSSLYNHVCCPRRDTQTTKTSRKRHLRFIVMIWRMPHSTLRSEHKPRSVMDIVSLINVYYSSVLLLLLLLLLLLFLQ